jgi:hypothetical protein
MSGHPAPCVPLWALQFQPWEPCGSSGAGWRPWPPLDPSFRLHARPRKAMFCTRPHAPEVHPAPASVTTGGSSLLSQLPPSPNVSLRRPCGAGVRPPQTPWSFAGPPAARTSGDPAVPCPLPPLCLGHLDWDALWNFKPVLIALSPHLPHSGLHPALIQLASFKASSKGPIRFQGTQVELLRALSGCG